MELTLLLLSLAAGAQAWPQLPNDPAAIKRAEALASRSLPVIPQVEDDPLDIVNVKRDASRDASLPGFVSIATHDDEKRDLVDEWIGDEDPEAPVHASRRGLPVLPPTDDVLGVPAKRNLPVLPPTDDVLGVPAKRSLPVLPPTADVIGLPVERREPESPGYVSFPLIHAERSSLVKRSFEMTIENRTDLAYYAPLKIGNPPQEVYAQVDTGSYELWVDPDCTKLAGSNKEFCEAVGQYEVTESKSAKSLGSTSQIKYGKGSADIAYYTDDVGITDSIKVKAMQFGVASSSAEQAAGVLGLGKGQGAFVKYNNFIDELAEQGLTKTRAFSIGLGAKGDGAGVIAFGGVDTKKFSGGLAKLPVITPGPDGVPRYWVNMKSISKTGADGKSTSWSGSSMPVFLDTGATLSLLPTELVSTIATDLGSSGLDRHGFYVVDCKVAQQPGSVDFNFDGVTIKVSYPEIIRQIGSSCWLGISPSDKFALLGDTVMRSMYAVFDTEEDNVYLAQYNNCGSDIKTINKSSDISGMKGSCSDKAEDPEESTTSKSSSAAASSTQAPKSTITTLITTTSGTSAVTLTTAVVPTSSGADSSPTPEVESPEGPASGSDEEPEDGKGSGSDNNSNNGGSGNSGNGGSSGEAGNGGDSNNGNAGNTDGNGDGGSAAGKVTPLSVLASAAAGIVVLVML